VFVRCKKAQSVNIKNVALKRSNIKEKNAGCGKYAKVERSNKYLKVSRILVRYADDFITVITYEKGIPIV
jgi:hypothetical protein